MEPPIRDSESNPKPLSENKDVVFIDTNLDTHLVVLVSDHDTVSDLKERILLEHQSCFPKLGQIQIHAMKVKCKGYFYHLADSIFVKSAFYGFNKSWFLSVDASPLGECGQNDCAGSPYQQVLLGNSDNALTGLINDEKEEHDFVNPSNRAVKDDNVICKDEMSNSVSSAKEKQKSARKDDTAEYDASVLRPGNDAVKEIEVMAGPFLNASKEVTIESEVLREHQHTEFNDNSATIGIGTKSMKEASEPARATNKQKKSKRSVIHDADVGEKKGKKRSLNSHETHLTLFRKDAEADADASNIRGGVQEEIYEDAIISKDISMSKPMLEKMEIGTDASLEGIPSKVKKSKKHNHSDVETKLQPSGVKEPKEPKWLNEDNLNIVLDQCHESEFGLTDRAEGRREVLQDDPKPMQLEECTPSEQNNNTEANIKESNVTQKAVDMNEMGEPVKSEKKKRRKRKDMDLDERTTRKEECKPSNKNNTDANGNVTSKVVALGVSALEKSEEKKRKTRKDKDSNVGTTVGEGIGRTDSSDSKNVIVKSLKSSDCNPASGDIGAEENPLNHTEVENIQQAEMKGSVVSATEKDDASGADNLGSLEQIETIANAEHVDKTRRKKSNKKQSTKSKSSSNMLTNDVIDSQKPLPSSDIGTLASPNESLFPSNTAEGIDNLAPVEANDAEKDDACGADNPGSLEQIETIANAEHADKTRRKKSNKKQSTKSKSSSNMLTNNVIDSQKPSPSSDIGTLASPNESLFPSNTAEGIDNLAPVEANDAAKDSTFSCEEKDEKNLEASLKDDRVNVEQQSPSQQVLHRSHLDKMVPNVGKTKRDANVSSQSNSDISSIREKGKPRVNASGKSMDSADRLPMSSPTMKGSKKVIHKKAGKASVNNAREVKGKTQQKKSLLSGAIFKDDSSDTSKDADKVDNSDASTKSPPANSLLSDFSDGDISEGQESQPNDSHGRKRLESGEQNDFKGSMSSTKGKPIDCVLRSSSRYKKARITASQLEGFESQPEFVPDSLAE